MRYFASLDAFRHSQCICWLSYSLECTKTTIIQNSTMEFRKQFFSAQICHHRNMTKKSLHLIYYFANWNIYKKHTISSTGIVERLAELTSPPFGEYHHFVTSFPLRTLSYPQTHHCRCDSLYPISVCPPLLRGNNFPDLDPPNWKPAHSSILQKKCHVFAIAQYFISAANYFECRKYSMSFSVVRNQYEHKFARKIKIRFFRDVCSTEFLSDCFFLVFHALFSDVDPEIKRFYVRTWLWLVIFLR